MTKTHRTAVSDLAVRLETAVSSVYVGDPEPVHLAVLGLLSGLHILIEDMPGVGKTTLALALSRAANLSFSRIQFTPDMLPGDVLGTNVWDSRLHDFIYRPGPVEANFILADELNRTSPRTQSAFLEAMQEGQVTVDGNTRTLPQPFFLAATQNPETFTGTFPLPEAELDRFGLAFSLGYPSATDEAEILRRNTAFEMNAKMAPAVCSAQEILDARNEISLIHVSEPVRDYIVSVVRATRGHPDIRLGASPRAALFLQHASRAQAAYSGRDYVIPEDTEMLAPAVLAHRIQISSRARLSQATAAGAIRAAAALVQKPTGL